MFVAPQQLRDVSAGGDGMAAAQRALRAASVLAAAGGRARRRARVCQLARCTPAPVRAAGRQEPAGVWL